VLDRAQRGRPERTTGREKVVGHQEVGLGKKIDRTFNIQEDPCDKTNESYDYSANHRSRKGLEDTFGASYTFRFSFNRGGKSRHLPQA